MSRSAYLNIAAFHAFEAHEYRLAAKSCTNPRSAQRAAELASTHQAEARRYRTSAEFA
jgi:hypothetical protein